MTQHIMRLLLAATLLLDLPALAQSDLPRPMDGSPIVERQPPILSLLWPRKDTRTPGELLKSLSDAGLPGETKPDASVAMKEPPQWYETLDALLSKPENFDRAWPVRQQAITQPGLMPGTLRRPIYMGPIITSDGETEILVMLAQDAIIDPGLGIVEYYRFSKDGMLVGADLISSGMNLVPRAITVKDPGWLSRSRASDIHITFFSVPGAPISTAHFIMEKDGLKFIFLQEASGRVVDESSANGLGDSVLVH